MRSPKLNKVFLAETLSQELHTNEANDTNDNKIEFDTTNIGATIRDIDKILDISRDHKAMITIEVFGPGGGNAAVTVSGISSDSAMKLKNLLKKTHGYEEDDVSDIT